MDRNSQIIRTSWVGIAANVLLAAFKAAVVGDGRMRALGLLRVPPAPVTANSAFPVEIQLLWRVFFKFIFTYVPHYKQIDNLTHL
jgi:hypothetical protein